MATIKFSTIFQVLVVCLAISTSLTLATYVNSNHHGYSAGRFRETDAYDNTNVATASLGGQGLGGFSPFGSSGPSVSQYQHNSGYHNLNSASNNGYGSSMGAGLVPPMLGYNNYNPIGGFNRYNDYDTGYY